MYETVQNAQKRELHKELQDIWENISFSFSIKTLGTFLVTPKMTSFQDSRHHFFVLEMYLGVNKGYTRHLPQIVKKTSETLVFLTK